MRDNKQAFADAFIDLLNRQTLESTTVKDILEESGMSKATFYRYFNDKYDVMHWIVKSKIEETVTLAPQIKHWDEWLTLLLEYFSANSKYYRQIILYQGQNSFAKFLINYSSKLTIERICAENKEVTAEDVSFTVQLFTVGCVHMISMWILNGCKTSVKDMIISIVNSLPQLLVPYMAPVAGKVP